MYKRLLVATDGSELSQRTFQSALALAKQLGSDVLAVRVVESPAHIAFGTFDLTELPADVRQRIVLAAEKDLDWVRQEANRAGIECRALRVDADHPWRGIIDTATEEQCDLIIMARYGRHSRSAKLVGSETQNVLTHNTIDILVQH